MSGTSALLALAKRTPYSWTADKQHIQIGGMTLPRKTLTPYRELNKDTFYPLDAVVFLLDSEAQGMKPAQYITECRAQGVMRINLTQKPQLLQFLRGEVSTITGLDMAGLERFERDGGAAAAAAPGAGTEADDSARAGKRQRVGDDAAVSAQKPVSEWNESDIIAEEFVLATHLSVLQVPKKNFSNLLELYHKASGDSKSKTVQREHAAKEKATSSAASAARLPLLNPRDPNYGVPIIVVPSAVSSVVNMYNAKQLLEHGIFESGEYQRVSKGAHKESMLTIHKASFYDPARSVKFQVIDDVTKLKTPEDWHRVVAVFVSGAAWQFSDWPKSKWANPAAIFENVCAFHLHFDDEALHPNITQWRTHRLPISKNKRHGDRSVVLDFWHLLNEFIAARNTVKKLNI